MKGEQHEQRLREEAARKNDLITYLAHDLKTPLTSVIGYLSLLDEVPDMPASQKEKYVHVALQRAQRLENLINEFFEITRYNFQQVILEKETVDLPMMLLQLTDEFYPLLQAHGNGTELLVEDGLTVYADPDRLPGENDRKAGRRNEAAGKKQADRDCAAAPAAHPEGITFESTMFKELETPSVTGGTILGGKTGYTAQAGLCLASLVGIGGREYILVTAKAEGSHQTQAFHMQDAVNVYEQIGSIAYASLKD